MSERPWLKFYPDNWRSDPKLRMCSIGARGLWMEMLCLMHEAEPRGHLLVNGNPVSDRQLALLVGAFPDEVATLLAELEQAGVFSRDDEGIIYSRRMVRDTQKSVAGKENGSLGGNPNLTASVGEGVNPEDNPDSSKPLSKTVASGFLVSKVDEVLSEFESDFWPQYPHKIGKPAALKAFLGARKRAELSAILAGLAAYRRDKPPDRAWCNPATFLNQDRWADEPAGKVPTNGAAPKPPPWQTIAEYVRKTGGWLDYWPKRSEVPAEFEDLIAAAERDFEQHRHPVSEYAGHH